MERPFQRGSMPRQRVVVIGGGISGLSAAYRLDRLAWEQGRRIDIRLLEGSHRLGGQVRSERVDDCLIEAGPDSMVAFKPAGAALCRELGLEEELIHPRAGAGGMQVAHRGRLCRLPQGFVIMGPTELGPLLGSSLFSWRGKLRMACEPLIPAGKTDADESLRDFVTRRFGREAFERAAEPILGGLFTADADRLSMQLAMPRFREMEKRHGSVLRGAWESRRTHGNGKSRPSPFVTTASRETKHRVVHSKCSVPSPTR
jgi:oxygen-dependent protoporphyrinogen oxidase